MFCEIVWATKKEITMQIVSVILISLCFWSCKSEAAAAAASIAEAAVSGEADLKVGRAAVAAMADGKAAEGKMDSVDERSSMISRVSINGHLYEYDPLIPFKAFLAQFGNHLEEEAKSEEIRTLDFSSRNKLIDGQFVELQPLLKRQTTLEKLNLRGNLLTIKSLDLCVDLILALPHLGNVCIGSNAIPYVDLVDFKEDSKADPKALDKITAVLPT